MRFFAFTCLAVLLAASAAQAADPWSGAYVGVNGTYALAGTLRASREGGGQKDLEPTGPIFGGQIGYQWEFAGGLVVGAETDYQFLWVADERSHLACPAAVCGADVTERERVSIDRVGTVRGRIGFAFGDYLPYLTAGYAYGHAVARADFDAVVPDVKNNVAASGWAAGSGVEYKLGGPWSARVEYGHLSLSEGVFGFRANIVRLGINILY